MEYTGTRYSTKVVSGYNQLSGGAKGMFVSNRLSTQTEADPVTWFSNAGGCSMAHRQAPAADFAGSGTACSFRPKLLCQFLAYLVWL
jgi:hypothetical protein